MPDLAMVRIGVDGEGESREDAYQVVSTAAAEVDLVLAANERAIDRVTTAALTVHPKTRWRKGENQITGWQASRVSLVEISDTSQVGELLNLLAGAGANVGGLSWMVAPTNDSFALARQRAGEDARARAEQYARSLGVTLGPVAWAAEPGLRTSAHAEGISSRVMAARAAAGAADEPIEVAPEEVTVSASLEVGYEIAHQGA